MLETKLGAWEALNQNKNNPPLCATINTMIQTRIEPKLGRTGPEPKWVVRVSNRTISGGLWPGRGFVPNSTV